MTDNIKVEQGDSRRRTVGVKNIEPVSGIKIVRDYSESEPSISSVSDSGSEPRKKTKKIFRKKVHQSSDYNAFLNPKKQRPPESDSESEPDSEYSSIFEDGDSDNSGYSNSGKKEKERWEEKQKQKQDLLIKIQMLEKKGFEFSKKFNMTSSYEEIEFEYEKIKKFIESQASIKFARRCLMACVTGLEFLNKRFDPFNVKLEGWSENVMESVDDYDNIFERLHEKYSSKAEIAPEIELLLTLGGSAFMFHLTNSLLKSPFMDNQNPIAQNNPNFMASMMSTLSQGMKEMSKPPPPQAKPQTQPRGPPQAVDTRSGGRKEMNGPNIDQSLFNGTPLMTNYPKPPVPGFTGYHQDQQSDDEDRFSIASSDSSLSTVSSKKSKKINIKKKGIELNIS
jgi:hypothetical protein